MIPTPVLAQVHRGGRDPDHIDRGVNRVESGGQNPAESGGQNRRNPHRGAKWDGFGESGDGSDEWATSSDVPPRAIPDELTPSTLPAQLSRLPLPRLAPVLLD